MQTTSYFALEQQQQPFNMTMLDKLLFSKTAKTSKDKAEQASPRHIEVHRRPSSEIASKAFAGSPRMSDSEQHSQVSTAKAALPKRQQTHLGVTCGSCGSCICMRG
jgi:hypothetical protein